MLFSMLGILSALLTGTAQAKSPENQTAVPQVERGAYIVNDVAMCVQCHTPRTDSGVLDRVHLLRGAPMPVVSPWPNRPFAVRAPQIAGLPGFRDEDILNLLTNGVRLDGRVPQAPMPQYRLNRQDAEAVIAYLRSLP